MAHVLFPNFLLLLLPEANFAGPICLDIGHIGQRGARRAQMVAFAVICGKCNAIATLDAATIGLVVGGWHSLRTALARKSAHLESKSHSELYPKWLPRVSVATWCATPRWDCTAS